LVQSEIKELKLYIRELRLKEISLERSVYKETFQKKEDIVIDFINDLETEDFYDSWQDVMEFVEMLSDEEKVSSFLEDLICFDKTIESAATREDINEVAKFILMLEIYDESQSKEKVLAFLAELVYENTLDDNKEVVLDFINKLLFDQDVDDISEFLDQLKIDE